VRIVRITATVGDPAVDACEPGVNNPKRKVPGLPITGTIEAKIAAPVQVASLGPYTP
jgi:hypothetical protein